MKKNSVIILSCLCGMLTALPSSAAFAERKGLYEYRTRQPHVEVSPVQEEWSVPFQPLRLRPPVRPLLTPPPGVREALEPVKLRPPEGVAAKSDVQAVSPQQLAKPFFTDLPVETVEARDMLPLAKPPVVIAENKPPKTVKPAEEVQKPAVEPPASVVVTEAPVAETVLLPAEPAKTAEAAPPVVPTHADMMIAFEKNSSTLTPEAEKALDSIVAQLNDLPDTRLQIRAYAADGDDGQSSARRMSLSRALIVRSYMTEKGIKPIRLDVRALGTDTDKTPIDRVDLVFVR